MSDKYHHQSVEITIPKDSELYRRIKAQAAKDGVTVEAVIKLLTTMMMQGTYDLMTKRMDILEKKK